MIWATGRCIYNARCHQIRRNREPLTEVHSSLSTNFLTAYTDGTEQSSVEARLARDGLASFLTRVVGWVVGLRAFKSEWLQRCDSRSVV